MCGKSRKCPKKNCERPSESWRTVAQGNNKKITIKFGSLEAKYKKSKCLHSTLVCLELVPSWNTTRNFKSFSLYGQQKSLNLKTYRPSRWAGADSFTPTDATILAGASCLAFPFTLLLTSGDREDMN